MIMRRYAINTRLVKHFLPSWTPSCPYSLETSKHLSRTDCNPRYAARGAAPGRRPVAKRTVSYETTKHLYLESYPGPLRGRVQQHNHNPLTQSHLNALKLALQMLNRSPYLPLFLPHSPPLEYYYSVILVGSYYCQVYKCFLQP